MAKVKGDSVRFYKGTSVLDLEMEISLTANLDTIESTVKGDGWKTFKGGDKTWECNGKANIDFSANYNMKEVFADFIAGGTIGISIGYNSNYYSGGALLTQWGFNGTHNDLGRFTFIAKGASGLTETSSISSGFPYVFPFIFS